MHMKKPELLLPAGNPEVLKIAIRYGADAVYIGAEQYSLRAKAGNFTREEMKDSIEFAHARGKKVYVTANIFARNSDIDGARNFFQKLSELHPDAILISDPGLFAIAKDVCPEIDLHISTQANTTNYASCNFWYEQGARRIVTARELSLDEIRTLQKKIPSDLEIETFVHGAMCISYSGRCLLSNYFTGRDANLGACTHACRWKYSLVEETRPGQYLPIEEDERGTYILNSKDLCMIRHIPELCEAGIDSFKIEGRMKTALYVATMARAYRRAIDLYFSSPEQYEARKDDFLGEVSDGTYRSYTTGFFFGRPDADSQIYESNTYIRTYTYLGTVGNQNETGGYHIEQRNKFSVGETIEVMKPNGDNIEAAVLHIYDENGAEVMSAPHPKQNLWVDLGVPLEPYDILRRREPEREALEQS